MILVEEGSVEPSMQRDSKKKRSMAGEGDANIYILKHAQGVKARSTVRKLNDTPSVLWMPSVLTSVIVV